MKTRWPLFPIFGLMLACAAAVSAADQTPRARRDVARADGSQQNKKSSGLPFDVKMSTIPAFSLTGSSATISTPGDVKTSTQAVPVYNVVPDPVAPAEPAPSEEMKKARAQLDAGDWRGARRTCLSYLDKDGKSSEAWTLLAKTYSADKNFKKAIKRFEKALKFDPHNAEAFYGKGMAYESLGKVDEAANEYQAAMRADPKFNDARAAWQRIKDSTTLAPQ